MPNYSRAGKILVPLSIERFQKGMTDGKFCQRKHKGFAALLFHTGVRVTEALRSVKEQFSIQEGDIYFDVLKRLKQGIQTPALKIPLTKPFAYEIQDAIEKTKVKTRVWPYTRKTGYNIISRVWFYPHHLRLSKITDLFEKGFSTTKIRLWSGLTLAALEFYTGLVDIGEMGEA